MTNLVDLDRALSAFLEDGPNTAPEAPVIAALAHARTTPRRPDPLRRFRADVMAPLRSFGVVRRPGLLLGLAALLIAGVGVAVIGSRSQEPSVVVPGPSGTDAPTTSVERLFSIPPVSPFIGKVQVVVAAGQPLTLTLSDTTGVLLAATSLTPGDGASVETGTIAITADPTAINVLIATWSGSPCETRAAMNVDERHTNISITHENCGGDATAFDRVVRLTFRDPVDAVAWNGTALGEPEESLPAPSPSEATTHVDLSYTADSPVSVDIVDLSGHLSGAAAGRKNEGGSVEFITATNVDPLTVRLAWPGWTCDTVHRLTIAADLGLTIDRPNCQSGVDVVGRSLILTFDRAVDANTLDTGLFSGRAGTGVPTWAVTGMDSSGGRFDLGIDDPAGFVVNVGGLDSGQTAAPDRIRLDQAGQAVIELVWNGRACETTPRLTIDPTGSQWHLSVDACVGSSADVVRRVSLKLGAPRSVDSITVETSVVVR
jgi:hypothetical protein